MNKNTLAAVLGVLLLLSLAGNGFLAWKKSAGDKAVKEKLEVLATKDSLQRALQKMEDSIRPLLTNYQEENQRLGSKIDELEGDKNPRIAALLSQIASLRASVTNAGSAIASSGGKPLTKEEQKKLAELKKLLEEEKEKVNSLMAQISEITKQRDDYAAQVQAEKDGKANMERENADMKDRIARGAIPQFGTLITAGIAKKGDQQVESTKAKSIEKLKITFDVLDNPLIKEPVEEEVTIRLIGPEGEVLSTSNQKLADKSSVYSLKQTIISDGEMHKVKWYYPTSGTVAGKLKKGKYTTELWSRQLLKQKNTFELN
ncbi:MAG: hypothetical protein JNL57_08090 [Bacteroidetes bacterium]|nr:hypothetical protein [Bacteroidota bacterium]